MSRSVGFMTRTVKSKARSGRSVQQPTVLKRVPAAVWPIAYQRVGGLEESHKTRHPFHCALESEHLELLRFYGISLLEVGCISEIYIPEFLSTSLRNSSVLADFLASPNQESVHSPAQ